MITKFLPYLKAHRWQVALALGQVFLVAAFELLKPWPLQIVIDYVLGRKTPPSDGSVGDLLSLPTLTLLLFASIALVVAHFGAGALTLWHNYTTIRVGQSMVNDLRGDLYAHLQRLSLAYHSRQRVGDLMYRITSDSFAVQTMIMNGLLPILSAVILLGGMLIVLFPIDPTLTVLSLTIVPVLFARSLPRSTARSSMSRPRSATSTAGSTRSCNGVWRRSRWCRPSPRRRRSTAASWAPAAKACAPPCGSTTGRRSIRPRSMWLIAVGTAIVVYAGARAVLSGNLSLGQLIVFISYLAQLYAPINQITQSWGLIAGRGSARAGSSRCSTPRPI